jgi:hypothetical protein
VWVSLTVSLSVMGAPAVVRGSLYLPLGVSVSLSVGLPHGVSHCGGSGGGRGGGGVAVEPSPPYSQLHLQVRDV